VLVNSPDLFECYVPYTGFTSLASSADVVWLIGAEIARANGDLSRAEQIKVSSATLCMSASSHLSKTCTMIASSG